MESLLNQITDLGAGLNEEGRTAVVNSLDNLLSKFESPFDSLRRAGNGQLTIAAGRIACDLGIFQKLAATGERSLGDLARETGASEDLLGSILRFLASVHMIEEHGDYRYGANKYTEALAQPSYEGALRSFSDVVGPAVQVWPDHLKALKYCSVKEAKKTAFQVAFDTELPTFDYIKTRPEMLSNMQHIMTIQRSTDEWFSKFPVAAELQSWSQEKPAFVDIGGGWGHQCIALQKAHPQLTGHMVLQDLPETIQEVGNLDGVQLMPHDIFQPQPVEGAKFYYIRNVLHDWPDEKCIEILRNIAPAMHASSRILIDEVIVPDQGVNWQIASMDLFMMSSFGAQERTNKQWRDLCERAGLQVLDIVSYSHAFSNSVIVVVPK